MHIDILDCATVRVGRVGGREIESQTAPPHCTDTHTRYHTQGVAILSLSACLIPISINSQYLLRISCQDRDSYNMI